MRTEDIPIINGGLAGFTGVADDYAALEFVEIDSQRFTADAARLEMNRRCATEGRREMILCAGGDLDYDGLDVPADVDPIPAIVA